MKACSVCARRKVKCDKGSPCANCLKAQTPCVYEAPAPQRPRKRAADEELLARIARYEQLMRRHHIDFAPYANTWVSCSSSTETETELSLWSTLCPELKHPPIQTLKDIPPFHLSSIMITAQPELHTLHPEPRHLYRLWQTFVERVNPLIKIVHVPTLQQRVLDGDVADLSASLSAMLFSIYMLAVTALSPEECLSLFKEPRDELVTRYRNATLRALVAADFLTTRDLEVLQAFVLYLFADCESELAATLTSAALRIGQKMGLHRDEPRLSSSFFEREMRIRLWWQLCGLDARCRPVSVSSASHSPPELGIRLPLNVNDADLHPDMTDAPLEPAGPTEMVFVLMKLQVTVWLQSGNLKIFDFLNPTQTLATEVKDAAIDQLEAIYLHNHRRLDIRIPIHRLAVTVARLNVARLRFKVHHPRWQEKAQLPKQRKEMLFRTALTVLETLDTMLATAPFSTPLLVHLTTRVQMDPLIYVLSELRERAAGEDVSLAWRLVERIYDAHPELIPVEQTAHGSFFTALGDLTIEAWQKCARTETVSAPVFIQLLLDRHGVLSIDEWTDWTWEWNDLLF
ncbi:hypothetical protein ASPZODRAFT_152870 [Penicilliopsis zonata CBS 506.65]|uniref:Zn(2)-C6 fungal-type domain-containing protein n=1 Tax=Penicilliopsis zonata CBS 506.65 TaxID=1073090 RepID=A0A1L9SFD9_9EURO|nr:hypothetical protein ASPZODRAFT_152870 [Penicilliopsis zonata CBS 506.65]OJJ45916.1 hypothetical protein ASPZODRAFT_152870 [Penicilliopsis zonata CBS 506.65]